ncbi:hypothetical protein KAR91_16865 [Candidatus Pacearchaeota archaeon]|nr:hypothetical protein [Candidatus Pacearchaeota archaeon]
MGRKSKKTKPKPQKKDNSILFLKLLIIVVIFIILYLWVFHEEEPEIEYKYSYAIVAKQGEGNISSGCFIELVNVVGPELEISNYYFKVGKEDHRPISLRWPDDGNTTRYNIDSGSKANDGDYWGHFEKIGFDTSSELMNQNKNKGADRQAPNIESTECSC